MQHDLSPKSAHSYGMYPRNSIRAILAARGSDTNPESLKLETYLRAQGGNVDALIDVMGQHIHSSHEYIEGLFNAIDPDISVSTQLYDRMKPFFRTVMDYMAPVLPPVVNELFSQWPTGHLYRELVKQDAILDRMEVWAALLPGEGQLYGEKYNYKFLTENEQGAIVEITPDEIIAQFQASPLNHWQKPADFERIVLTSSHARGENEEDIRHITHGIDRLARDSWSDAKDATYQKPKIIFACDTEKNAFLNGIRLQRRLNEIDRSMKTGEPDQFHEISDGAKRMAKLILACMCENYYENDERLFSVDDPRPLAEIFADNKERIRLTHDAGRVAQHFQLMGYSKGGNVVSDAMRYLEHELRAVDKSGRDIIETPTGEIEHVGINTFGSAVIRNLLRNIDTASIAAKELPLTEAQKKSGIQRVSFNNKYDDLTKHDDFPSSWHDEKYMIEGVREHQGHAPEDAMGNDDKSGYILNDPIINRRLREFFAPHYGKAAVAHLHFRTNLQGPREPGLVLETAAGTPDSMFETYKPAIIEALETAGLHDVAIDTDGGYIGQFRIRAREDIMRTPSALDKLQRAFTRLLKNTPGLVIAKNIIDSTIPEQIEKVRGKSPG